MERNILKAKLIRDSKHLEVEFEEMFVVEEPNDDGEVVEKTVTNELKALFRHEAHGDLFQAYDNLTKHLAAICEIIEPWTLNSEDVEMLIRDITVTKISLGGEDDYAGVTLVGQKKLSTGKVLNLVAPFTVFDPELSDYMHASRLYKDVQEVIEEVDAYIGGKRAPVKQLELFPDGVRISGSHENE